MTPGRTSDRPGDDPSGPAAARPDAARPGAAPADAASSDAASAEAGSSDAASTAPAPIDAVARTLDDVQALVEGARTLPMSASAVVNRLTLLELLSELRGHVAAAFTQARGVLGERADVVAEGRREAERVLEQARAERRRLLGGNDLLQDARAEAEQVLARAREQADRIREEAEAAVETRLAHVEVVLTHALGVVQRGRRNLAGHHDLDELRSPEPDPQDAGADEAVR